MLCIERKKEESSFYTVRIRIQLFEGSGFRIRLFVGSGSGISKGSEMNPVNINLNPKLCKIYAIILIRTEIEI